MFRMARVHLFVWTLVLSAAPPAWAESPVLYFSTGDTISRLMIGDTIIQRVVSAQSADTSVRICWVQIVPALERLYWSESRFCRGEMTFWSSDLNGGDIRAEFGVEGGVIDSIGERIYYYAEPDLGFARVNLDGTGAELLGFGQDSTTWKFPGIDTDSEWLYFTAEEQTETPGESRNLYAIYRGNVATGVVEQLALTTFEIGFSRPEYEFQFDDTNSLFHILGFKDGFSADDTAVKQFQLVPDSIEELGRINFGEGSGGGGPLYAFDPNERQYYFVEPTDTESQTDLFRIAYDEMAPFPGDLEIIARSKIVFSFPRVDGSSNFWVTPSTLQFDPAHTIDVPEPNLQALTTAALVGVLIVAVVRRRQAAAFRIEC